MLNLGAKLPVSISPPITAPLCPPGYPLLSFLCIKSQQLIPNLATHYENSEGIYSGQIKFLPNLPCCTPLSNRSCQQLWQNYLDTLTDKVCFQTPAPRYTYTTRQFVQANTRKLVKGQAFPWKEGSSQTAMPKGSGHTAGVFVCGVMGVFGCVFTRMWLCVCAHVSTCMHYRHMNM